MLKILLNLNFLSDKEVHSLSHVVETAARVGDTGVLDWANRALADAKALGHMRARDVETLNRLEVAYGRDYYRGVAIAA